MAGDDTTGDEAPGRQPRRGRRIIGHRETGLPYAVAAAAVGMLMAVMARVLIVGGEVACDAVRGTTTCGSAGGFMLLVIAGLMVYAGMQVLRLLAVPEPGVTSVLGVAVLTILVLSVLLDQIFSPWMWLVLPIVAAVAYALSAWAATTLAEMGKQT